jgi:hypothetical protein
MRSLYDAQYREGIRRRLTQLRPDSHRRWGRMSVDQMLWHLNVALENALGRVHPKPMAFPLPKRLLKLLVIHVPWRKGKTPTAPEFVAKETYDFEHERARALTLIDEFVSRPVEGPWGRSAAMGEMTGYEWGRLQAKHFDYHLRQFGV